MANKVTTLRTQVFLAGGSLYVTALRLSTFTSISDTKARPTTLRLGAFTNDKTNGPRATTLRLGVYANDKTSPVLATTQRIQTWVSLDSAFYALPPFGSHKVFTPDFFIDPLYEFPTPPTIEVNPYRAVEPNTDLQQILREQHNTTQAGDSTFHWGVLTQIYNEPLYNLGSLGKFYHDDLGIIHARYCRFVDFNPTDSKATPVGLRKPSNLPWTVTNQLVLSDPDAVVGIAIPYDTKVNIGTWYGWVITDGFVPTEVALVTSSLKYPFGTEYAWAANGAVRQELDSNSVGYRVQIGGPPWLVPGAFYVNTDRSSLGRMNGLITTRITPLVNDIDGLDTRLGVVEGLVAGHTIEIGAINKRHDDFTIFMTKEVKSLADALAAIRALMPDTNFKVYVDTAIIALRGYADTQLTLVGGVANAGLARANEAYALAQSISYDGIQSQLDAINNAMGGITNRLIGFSVTIDTNVLTEGQTLVSYLASTDAFGVNYYDFRPLDYKTSALLDVDWSIPPTDGQVLLWNAASSKFIPGLASGGLPDAPSDGTIYGRKDGAWEAVTGGGVAPSVIQQATAIGNSASVTFGSALTPGNLLVAFITHYNNVTTATGWMQIRNSDGASTDGNAIFIKRVKPGDSTTQSPCTGVTAGCNLLIKEVADVGPVDTSSYNEYKELVSGAGSVGLGVWTPNCLILGMFASVSANAAPTAVTGVTAGTTVTGTSTSASPRQLTPFSAVSGIGTVTANVTYASGTTRQYGLMMLLPPR